MAEMREITASAQIHVADAVDIMISPTDIEVSTSRYDESAELQVSGLTDLADDTVASRWPEESEHAVGLTVEVNGTLIGSGTLDSGHTDSEGLWTGTAFGAVRHLEGETTSMEFVDEDIETVAIDILEGGGVPPDDDADEESGVPPGAATYTIDTPSNYEEGLEGGSDPRLRTHWRVSGSYTHKPTTDALTHATRQIPWRWWVDASNTIRVAPNYDSEEFQPQYILDTSAGIQRPPYQSVVITGARRPLGSAPGGLEGPRQNLIGKGVPIRVRVPEGAGEPVFRHTDRSIKTVERAEIVAQQVWEEMLTQRRGGSITMLGNAELRPLDGVRVPEQMGGELYLVSSLTTKVNNSDGFVQEIDVGGLLDAGPGGELADPPDTEITPIEGVGEDE